MPSALLSQVVMKGLVSTMKIFDGSFCLPAESAFGDVSQVFFFILCMQMLPIQSQVNIERCIGGAFLLAKNEIFETIRSITSNRRASL